MLGAFNIKYLPCTAVKGQVLANFIAEFIKDVMEDKEFISGTLVDTVSSLATWEIYTNGVANQKGSGVGIVLVSPEKLILEKSLWLVFPATNNEVEYGTLLAGMAMVVRLEGKVVEVYSNSRLVVW